MLTEQILTYVEWNNGNWDLLEVNEHGVMFPL